MRTMQPIALVFGMAILFFASQPAQAQVWLGPRAPVVVSPAPVIVAPGPVVVRPAPIVVARPPVVVSSTPYWGARYYRGWRGRRGWYAGYRGYWGRRRW
jgi:hypothetical protein